MPRFGLATLNHSPLHGLPTQWERHLDAASNAGFEALAPDIFWLRALGEEGVSLETLASALQERDLVCMEIAGIAIGSEERTEAELEENLRYARALSAEFVNARVLAPVDADVIARARRCAEAFRKVGTRVALEFSRGTKLNSIEEALALAEAVGDEDVGVTLDTWHFCLHPDGPHWEALEALPLDRLANVQLSDGVPYGEGEFGRATMDRRRLPGEGGFDLRRIAGALAAKGFDGAIVVEVLNAEERSSSVADFASRAARGSRESWTVEGT